jgi:uncharacterized protein YbaR (Trm112 family)
MSTNSADVGGLGPLGLPVALWEVLACPADDHGRVEADTQSGQIVCTSCGRRYDIRDGVPVMLVEEATLPSA